MTDIASAADYTWTGATALGAGAANWSNSTNWGGSAPSGTVGMLIFPALTSGACASSPPTSACYESHNDVGSLSAGKLEIDDGVGYSIDGNGITLGAGGLVASPSADDLGFGIVPELNLPVALGAPQAWSIEGGSANQELLVHGDVSGQSSALAVAFSGASPFLGFDRAEVGAVAVSGEGGVSVKDSLNGTDGNPVSLANSASLYSRFGRQVKVGPLSTANHSGIVVGQSFEGGAGILAVMGGVTLDSTSTFYTYIDQPGTDPGADFSQLNATGAVDLASSHLSLTDGAFFTGSGYSCEALTPGDIDTLVASTGTLIGTFNGVPDGTTVPVQCIGSGTAPTARINYNTAGTPDTVTATILTAGGGPPIPTTTALQASNAAPATGEAVTYTATVTPHPAASAALSGSVQFLDGGQPIGACVSQALTSNLDASDSSSASCTLSYAAAGSHSVTASYAGKGHFGGSSSSAQVVTVHAGSASDSGGGSASSSGSVATASPPSSSLKKPLKCKKGFKKAKKHGKSVCIKTKHGKRRH